jgi:hypothetical protein
MEKPKRKCRKTKNLFRFSKPECLDCPDAGECRTNTRLLMKEQEKPFRTIPWVVLQDVNLSGPAKYLCAALFCDAKRQTTERDGPDAPTGAKRRGFKYTEIDRGELLDRWGRRVTPDVLRKHLVNLERDRYIKRQYGKIGVRPWSGGLVIDPLIHNDGGLTDTEKIIIAGFWGFDKWNEQTLADKLGISVRTVFRVKKKYDLDRLFEWKIIWE